MSALDSTDETNASVLEDDRLAAVRTFSWPQAILTGAAAWLLGYLLTVALVVIGPASMAAPSRSEWLKQVGYVFYNAQFVDGVVTAPSDVFVPGGRRINLLLGSTDLAIPIAVYFAIPIVAILLASAVFGYRYLREANYATAGLGGFAMAIGYVALAVVGTYVLVRTTGDGVATLAPDRLQTVTLAFAYPFVLGTVGAAAGMVFNNEF